MVAQSLILFKTVTLAVSSYVVVMRALRGFQQLERIHLQHLYRSGLAI